MLSPILKWAGGKRQIMKELTKNFPEDFESYFEPFVGAGSVVMELENNGRLHNKRVYIGDIMEPLINVYKTVKTVPMELIQELENQKYLNNKEAFAQLKKRFNELKCQEREQISVEQAALFIYLNKAGFNGMYRENSKGEFNIPFGKQTKFTLCNKDALLALAEFLQKETVEIKCDNYAEIEIRVNKGDFVYMDPPYHNTFSGYNKTSFGENEQQQLMECVQRLTIKGCKVAVSNSDTEFIRNLYKDVPNVRFIEIKVKRLINSRAEERKVEKTELLIVNY